MSLASDIGTEDLDFTADVVNNSEVKDTIMTLAERPEARGEARGEKRMLTKVLTRRFGADFSDDLNRLEIGKLDLLLDLLDQFDSADEVREWIEESSA